MNRLHSALLALLLPLAGLAALWGWTHYRAGQGTEWQVPVQGYDPRDLLRGHYITFRYDWPGLEAGADLTFQPDLCIEGTAPVIRRVQARAAFDGPPPRTGCRQFVRRSDRFGLDQGILYVPQDKAAGLEEKLRDPRLQGMVTIRVRDDGHITPLRMDFRPRSEPLAGPASTP